MTRRIRSISVVLTLLPIAVPPAAADVRSYCVSCAGPDQIYECRVTATGGHPSDAALLFHCIGELARRHEHASCKAQRAQSDPCTGVPEDVAYRGAEEQQVPFSAPSDDTMSPKSVTQAPPTDTTAETAAAPEPASDAPPKTLVELTDKTVKSMDEGVQKTGETIGKAAKSTWTCITSLFADCN